MIRFLQQDSRITKAIFVVIIGFVAITMVIYLIPGLMGGGAVSEDAYAIVYPHWYSRYIAGGDKVTQQRVDQMVNMQLKRQNPQYASNPMIVNMYQQQVGQRLIQQQVLLAEANRLGIHSTDKDVIDFLHKGQFGEYLFPKGVFIGQDKYTDFLANQFGLSVTDFEDELRQQIQTDRLRALIVAGVTVSDDEIKDEYRKQNIKIKFDYAVISGEELRKTINPSDAELQAFFTKSAAKYANAVPETRSVAYFSFTVDQLPGGVPKVPESEIQAYYTAHQSEYLSPDQARSRHILISVPAGADPKVDAAAKAKAESILKQIQAGGNFAELAKKNSDDPGSKDSGGELGFAKPGTMVPEFDKAIFSQKIGDTAIVKSQFGYHIVQVEERQTAHTQSLSEVLPTIQITLVRQKLAKAEEDYAQALVAEAAKNGLQKTAEAHHLEFATSEPLPVRGVIAALPDSSKVIAKAFQDAQGAAPDSAPTGEGYAIFQVANIIKAHAPDFNIYKAQILEDFRRDRLPALLTEKTTELANKAKSYKDLSKAAREVGATVKTSDLVGESGQVPDMGAVNPDLFNLNVGDISGPETTARSGAVVKILEKQQPSAEEIAKNLDQTRDQVLQQRQGEAFNLYISSLTDKFKKEKRIILGAKALQAESKVPKF
jgi:peptidyl-prolyl cis-trans isomerase D